jgi:ABC-type dipeptide/oligopeptide/nickel transport system permease subunit
VKALLRNRGAVAGALVLVLLAILAAGADLLVPHGPRTVDLDRVLEGPSGDHWLGTDDLGQDLLARLLHGARISLLVGAVSVGIAVAVGVPLGAVAGFAGGRVDTAMMRVTDVMLAFPSIVLAIAVVAALGPSLANLMIAVGVVAIPTYARQVRASVLEVKSEDFVTASRALGAHPARVLLRSVLPNCLTPLLVLATLDYGVAILEAAALSFLGLGPEPGTPEWGKMLADAQNLFSRAPRVVVAPGLCISAAVLAFNLLGDGLRDALDPHGRR